MQEQEQQEPEDMEPELSFGQNKKSRPIGGGTKTLAERLSQSLRDPLRSKDYLGTVDKGEIMIDCHHHSKVISFKNKKGYLSQHAMEQLVGPFPLRPSLPCAPDRAVPPPQARRDRASASEA